LQPRIDITGNNMKLRAANHGDKSPDILQNLFAIDSLTCLAMPDASGGFPDPASNAESQKYENDMSIATA
jgi:hypothetical protein